MIQSLAVIYLYIKTKYIQILLESPFSFYHFGLLLTNLLQYEIKYDSNAAFYFRDSSTLHPGTKSC